MAFSFSLADERPVRLFVTLLTAAVLAACGGGSGMAADTSGPAQSSAAAAPDGGGDDMPDLTETRPAATDTGGASLTAVAGIQVLDASAAVSTGSSTAVEVNMDLIPTGSAGTSEIRIKPASLTPFATNIGAFRVACDFSHMLPDDPIVAPGQPGVSHLHAFFGNTGANAHSNAESIATTGNSTCKGGTVNRSAYWVPAMIDTRTAAPVKPRVANIYYKTGYNGIKPGQVQPFPAGLRMIAGNAKNTTAKGPFRYQCVGNGSSALWGPSIQNCPAGAMLWQMIFFPQCWDGVNLDSPDHKSHMSYTVSRACPATHPVPLPEITFNIAYDIKEADAPLHWRLSSDNYDRTLPGGYSSHGDWFNGWSDEVMRTWVQRCDQASLDCRAHLLGDGQTLY